MEDVSKMVEKFLTSAKQQERSPFIHVLNPIGLKNDKNIMIEMTRKVTSLGQDKKMGNQLEGLFKLSQLKPTSYKTTFADIGSYMKKALTKAQEKAKPIIPSLTQALTHDGRPKNLVPIFTYHRDLESYQDREHMTLGEISRFEVYDHFIELLKVMTEL